jgi:hypothetical protein
VEEFHFRFEITVESGCTCERSEHNNDDDNNNNNNNKYGPRKGCVFMNFTRALCDPGGAVSVTRN